MKRYRDLYSKVVELENIKKAITCASKEKTDRKSVQLILADIDGYALKIQDMLINHTFKPSPYEYKRIFDSARQKERIIKKPKFFPDQCVHWALMLICEPLIHKRLYPWSCASIKHRGGFYAKAYIEHALKDTHNTKYAYQFDIKKFYPSVDNNLLKDKLRRMFKDEEILWLFGVIIDSDKGLPIGNYTSQWLANFYLTDFDNFVKHDLRLPYMVRYADDVIIFSPNKRELRKARFKIEKFLADEKLIIKPDWKIFKVDSRPFDYIGFRFKRTHTTLRDNLFLRIKRRANKMRKKGYVNLRDARAMTSYWGYIKHSNSYGFYKKYVEPSANIFRCKEVISNETKQF